MDGVAKRNEAQTHGEDMRFLAEDVLKSSKAHKLGGRSS